MSFVASNPGRHIGATVGNGHCVALVRAAANVPHTSQWRPGVLVRGADVPPGTAIALFNDADRYANATDMSSHAAILEAQTAEGLRVIDQWVGHATARRLIRFRAGPEPHADDGDHYRVIEIA